MPQRLRRNRGTEMHMTSDPWLDAARHEDAQDAISAVLESHDKRQAAAIRDAVRDACLSGDATVTVPHVSIDGKRIATMLTEVLADHMHDQDAALCKLIACALKMDIIGACAAAEQIVSTVEARHAEDVCERLDISGEVLA